MMDVQDSRMQEWLVKKFQTNPDFLLREIGGESVLVPVGEAGLFDNSIINLNETCSYLWKLFEEPRTPEEAILQAKEDFDANEMEIERDVISFITQSFNLELLQEVQPDA